MLSSGAGYVAARSRFSKRFIVAAKRASLTGLTR
jgi:hypothetical protein